MDVARGGQFIQHPGNYPPEAWYHYDDYTCDYECMAVEYLYWCIVTDMGILSDNQIKRLKEIKLNLRPTDLRPELYYKITELYEEIG